MEQFGVQTTSLIAVIGALFYAEPFDPFVLIGGAVIFAGILLNIRAQFRTQPVAHPA